MKRPFVFGIAFAAAFFASFSLRAEDDGAARALVDRLAADFYEDQLRPAQSRKIASETAAAYRRMSPAQKARFREDRKNHWNSLSEAERNALRGVKAPDFDALSEDQKDVFRAIARRRLGADHGTRQIDDNEI